jgi:hypothetical protein
VVLGIRGARFIGATDGVDTRECRVEFSISINDMVEFLRVFLQLGFQYANAFSFDGVVFVPAIAAIVFNCVGVVATCHFNIQHIIANGTEFHY